jgi:hypothetical protein
VFNIFLLHYHSFVAFLPRHREFGSHLDWVWELDAIADANTALKLNPNLPQAYLRKG